MQSEFIITVSAYPFGESCLVGVTRYLRFGPTFCTSVCSSGSDLVTLTLTGWNRAGDALILDHLQIWGSPDDDQTWGELDALLRSNWRHPWGEHLRVDATVVDSGAWTQRVHDFCFPRLARRIWAGKGVAGHHPIFAPSRGKVKGARGRLFIIGVDTMHAVVDEPQSFRPSTPAVVAATSPLASALGGKSTCPYVPLAPPVPLALV